MTRTSTLFYLVDDFNLPSDMLLTPYQEPLVKDEHLSSLLSMLEIDPGDRLVSRILERLEEK